MNKKVFISFAVEDSFARDFLVGQAKNKNCPFEFIDMSVKNPWDESWKTKCRQKIRGCDAVVALLSKKTYNADGAKWEMRCANEEIIPMMGVHIHKDNKGSVPTELQAYDVIEWSWKGIFDFIDNLD